MLGLIFISVYLFRMSSIEEEEEMAKFSFDVPKEQRDRKSFFEELRKIRENDTRKTDKNFQDLESAVFEKPGFAVDAAMSEAIARQQESDRRAAEMGLIDKILAGVSKFFYKEEVSEDAEADGFSVDSA